MRTTMVAAMLAALWAAQPAAQTPANAAPPGNAESGQKLFQSHGCWTCHGTVAQGGGGSGPRIQGRVPPWPVFSKAVRRPSDEMVPYTEKVLPEKELADIFAWLRALPAPPPVASIPQLKPGAH